jgi:hypothetical protein
MSEIVSERTDTANAWQTSLIRSVATTALAVSFVIPNLMVSGDNFIQNRLAENSTISATPKIWYAMREDHKHRGTRIQDLRGKYSFVRTSSDEFARRKQDELVAEG